MGRRKGEKKPLLANGNADNSRPEKDVTRYRSLVSTYLCTAQFLTVLSTWTND